MKNHSKQSTFALYFRNFIFGVEDSLVSTVGLLSGIAIAGVPRATIFLTGMVLIFVEGFSMGVGSFLSEDSSEGFIHQGETKDIRVILAAIIMFISYFFAGFIPLFPYTIWETEQAFPFSILLSLVALFLLGLFSARVSHRKYLHTAFKMLIIGGLAIGLGVFVGAIVNQWGGIM